MRPLKSHFRAGALTTLETVLKQTKEARVFRRAQAVREVVAGHHVNAVSATFHFTNSALRKWVQRFATQGPQGLLARPRLGRPRTVTCALEQPLSRLVDQDPLQYGARHPCGVVVTSPPFSPITLVSNWGVKVSAAC
jgi:transposase